MLCHACSEVAELTNRGLHSALSLRACHSSCHSLSLPSQTVRPSLECCSRCCNLLLTLCPNYCIRTQHALKTSHSLQANYTLHLQEAKTSCTPPLTSATLRKQKAKTPSTPILQPSKHPKALATALATGMVRIMYSYVRFNCPISRVNHLRPLTSEWASIDERRTKTQNACFLFSENKQRSLTSFREKASGFCRCTLSVCIKCLSTPASFVWHSARWKPKTCL